MKLAQMLVEILRIVGPRSFDARFTESAKPGTSDMGLTHSSCGCWCSAGSAVSCAAAPRPLEARQCHRYNNAANPRSPFISFLFCFFSLSCSLSRSLAVLSTHRRPFLSATIIRRSSSQVLLRSLSHSFLFHVFQKKTHTQELN